FVLAESVPAGEQPGESTGSPAATVSTDKEVTKAQNLFPLAEEISGGRLRQKRDDYLGHRKWVLGYSPVNPNSIYIGWGEAKIQTKPDDLKFGQARVLAFETALMDAKGEFVRFKERETTTTTVRKLFQDSGDIPEEETA